MEKLDVTLNCVLQPGDRMRVTENESGSFEFYMNSPIVALSAEQIIELADKIKSLK